MAIKVQCTSCGHGYQVPETLAGKKVKCKHCGKVFPIPAPEDEFGDLDVAAPSPSSAGPRSGRSSAGTIINEVHNDDDPFERAVEQAGGAPLRDRDAVLTFNPAFRFPGNRGLETFLPIILATACLGWLVIQAMGGDNSRHEWVGPVRALLYMAVFAAVVFPIALIGVRKASNAARFEIPPQHMAKVLGIAAVSAALAAIFTLKGGTLANLVVGGLLGIAIALIAFVFLYRLQPQQIGPATGIVAGFLAAGIVAGTLVLVGVNVLLLAALSVGKSAHTYAQSPLGPAFSWHPDVPPNAQPRIKPRTPDPDVVTQPDETINPGPATTQATTIPSHPATNESPTIVENPEKMRPTTVAVNPGPATKMTEDPTVPPVVVPPPPIHPAPSSSLASAVDETTVGECDDVAFPTKPGIPAMLVIRTRGAIADEIESWTLNPPTRKLQIIPQHKSDEKDAYFLGPKSIMARIVEFPKPTLELRSIDEKTATAPPRRVELDVVRGGKPSLLGFIPNGNVVILWESSVFGIETIDSQSGNRVRLLALPVGFTPGRASLAISPDGRFIAAFSHAATGAALEIDDISGARFHRQVLLTSIPAAKDVGLAGLRFSPNGQKIALLYQEGGNALISIHKIPDGAVERDHIFFNGAVADHIADFRGSSLDWLPDGSALLINGQAVVDLESWNILGDLGVADVKNQHVFDRDMIALSVQPANGKAHVSLVKLNLEKIASLQGAKPSTRQGPPRKPAE